MSLDVMQLLKTEKQKRTQIRPCKNIVTALMHKMYINPHESNFVFLVGTGMENNNNDALTNWTLVQLQKTDLENGTNKSILDQLEKALEKLINE